MVEQLWTAGRLAAGRSIGGKRAVRLQRWEHEVVSLVIQEYLLPINIGSGAGAAGV